MCIVVHQAPVVDWHGGEGREASCLKDTVLPALSVEAPRNNRQPRDIVIKPACAPGSTGAALGIIELTDSIVPERHTVLFQPRQAILRRSC